MDITQIFESRKNNSKWNTSYPLSPNDWVKYRTDTSLIFNEKDGISYYIHIPFCKKLCSFCEYTRITIRKTTRPPFQNEAFLF